MAGIDRSLEGRIGRAGDREVGVQPCRQLVDHRADIAVVGRIEGRAVFEIDLLGAGGAQRIGRLRGAGSRHVGGDRARLHRDHHGIGAGGNREGVEGLHHRQAAAAEHGSEIRAARDVVGNRTQEHQTVTLTEAGASYTLLNSVSTDRRVPIAALEAHGSGLKRPECVVATRSGDVFVPEWPGGVTAVHPDGRTETWRATSTTMDLRPNGIALAADGSFLIANLGDDGGIWRLDRSGLLTPVLLEVDGVPIPPANFVTIDEQDRIWISVSTRHVPRQQAWRADVADGFVVLIDADGPRIVADGLCYTNEVRPDPIRRMAVHRRDVRTTSEPLRHWTAWRTGDRGDGRSPWIAGSSPTESPSTKRAGCG